MFGEQAGYLALQRLEKARDATISWILKEIEKTEQQLEEQ